jgi:hypothetical protein
MTHRALFVFGHAFLAFVGVMLIMVSLDAHAIYHGLPAALGGALVAGLVGWRRA